MRYISFFLSLIISKYMLHYLALPFYPPIARTLKRGTLLSSLILFENLFTPFCWITSFVLNEHTGYFFSCIIWNSSFALLRCYTCLLTKKLFDNIVSLKLLWWDLAHKKEVGQGQCWRKHRGRRVGGSVPPQTWIGKKVNGGKNITKKSSQREVG